MGCGAKVQAKVRVWQMHLFQQGAEEGKGRGVVEKGKDGAGMVA